MERLVSGFALIEAPTVEDTGTLLFSDTKNGGVRRLLADGTIENVILHRRGIGGLALHADGGHVISGRNVAWRRDEETIVLRDREHDGISFNDLTTDPEGRIYVGSLVGDPLDADSGREPGDLYLIDLDGSCRVVATGVQLSNGMGVSPDGSRLYHADTDAHAVRVYHRNPDGSLGERGTLHQWATEMPDGLAIDRDGNVWVAMASTGEVVGISEDGSLIGRIEIEVPMVTSLCFGGDDLRDLYIVTGAKGAPDDVRGSVYRTRAPVAGLPVAKARVRP